MTTTESRSSQSMESLQECLDTGHTSDVSLEQYFTPDSLARELMDKLPIRHPATIFDPQCGEGALLNCAPGWPAKYGIELDDSKNPGGVQVIHANCLRVFEAVTDVAPTLRFVVANANVPFGRRWKMRNGESIDSTLATWRFVTNHANCGFLIGNATTIEKLLIHESTEKIDVFYYERRQAFQYWDGLRPELQIGVLCWKRRDANGGPVADSGPNAVSFTPPGAASVTWIQIRSIIEEEKLTRPQFNIFLDHAGFLKTYLSQRSTFKLKLTPEQIGRLHRLNGCHPLGLTTEKETRDLMKQLVSCGLYTLQPQAQEAIERALADVNPFHSDQRLSLEHLGREPSIQPQHWFRQW